MWDGTQVLVTGGASFIGSHLVDSLLQKGAIITVADDFSSGRLENLGYHLKPRTQSSWDGRRLAVRQGDLKDQGFTKSVLEDIEVVFHLAASHGGRGYIETHPAECCSNMAVDQIVFEQASQAGVDRICYASSACVYPVYLQQEKESDYLLKEEDADPFVRDHAFADLEYGWAKLMGEMALRAYHRDFGMKTCSVRIFTVYGPRENETHSIIALIAKTFIKMDPFIIWGTGLQSRNFTYVQDTVDALIRAAERIEDGSAVNAGRDDRVSISEAAQLIFKIMGWRPHRILYDESKPVGVTSRAADLARAREVLGWEPLVSYEQGFARTVDWYLKTKDARTVASNLERTLIER